MDEDDVDMETDDVKGDDGASGDDDKLEKVGSSHACQFCSEAFTSELRLILHFREEHLDPEELLLSEDESDPEEDESKEVEEGSDVNVSMLDFVTDCERALLKELVIHPDPGSEEKALVRADHEPEADEEDNEEIASDPEEDDDEVSTEPEDLEEVARSPTESPKVILRQVPSKSSKVKAHKDDPGKDCSRRIPSGTAKTAAKKSSNKSQKTSSSKAILYCIFCNKSFSKPCKLQDHIRSHIGENPYFCKLCDKSFSAKNYLLVHMRQVHPKVTQFKCKLCSESFSTAQKLKYHMASHSEDRKFECEYCKMRYYRKKHLTRHINSHNRKRRYECDHCKTGFTRMDTLRTHMKKIHNIAPAPTIKNKERIFECEHCKNRFSRNSHLTRHVNTFHK